MDLYRKVEYCSLPNECLKLKPDLPRSRFADALGSFPSEELHLRNRTPVRLTALALSRRRASAWLRRRGAAAATTNEGSEGVIAAAVTPSHTLNEVLQRRASVRRDVGSWAELDAAY